VERAGAAVKPRVGSLLVAGLLAQGAIRTLHAQQATNATVATPAPPESVAPSAPRVPPARRGRWGGAIGIARLDADVIYDFRNSATPLAGASGPYTNAAIPNRYRWLSPYVSAGYRGAVAASRLGFGVEGEIAVLGWSRVANRSVIGTSPAGVPVTFTIERNGVEHNATVAVTVHLSYEVLPRLNLMVGGKETRLLLMAPWDAYRGPSQTDIAYFGAGHTPRFNLNAFVPWIGAEYFLGSHRSLQITADFVPTATEHLASTPWDLTFGRRRLSIAAAIRFFR
jgi:hypothetical protein